jgi:hypothetical protein
MPRTIITRRDLTRPPASAAGFPQLLQAVPAAPPPGPPSGPDDYKTKLMKYIPGEVISLYVTVDAMVRSGAQSPAQASHVYWFMLVFGLVATPLYLWRITHVTKPVQLGVSTVAYAVWVFVLGGPFAGMEWYQRNQLFAGIILPLYTFIVPLIDP